MQLAWNDHFREIVVPALHAYLAAEQRLTEAILAQKDVQRARYDALREGGAASFYIHHFADVVLRARPDWLPDSIKDLSALYVWLSGFCTMMKSEVLCADVALLGDVADALKHAVLTRRLEGRDVEANDAVLVTGSGYGELRYGEGKFGGVEQVLVLAKSGKRALSSILQNVVAAWERASH